MATNAFGVEVSKRDFSDKTRKKLAGKGDALKDGSFPIKDKKDLENAKRLVGRSKHPEAARRLIARRAKDLGVSKAHTDSKQYKALIWNKDVTGKTPEAKTNRKIMRRARLKGQAIGAASGAAAGGAVGYAAAGKKGALYGGLGGSIVGQHVGDYAGILHGMKNPNYTTKPPKKGSEVKKNAFGVEVHKGLFGAVADVAKPVKAAQAVTKMPGAAAGALKKVSTAVSNAPAALHSASTQMGLKATPMAMSGGLKGKVGSGIQHAAIAGTKVAANPVKTAKVGGAVGGAGLAGGGAFAAGKHYGKKSGTGF